MKIFAGIDGGGTKTRVALAREDGALLSYAEGGSCSYIEQGLEQARAELTRLWHAAWQNLGEAVRPVDSLFMGMGSILALSEARINCDMAESLGLAPPGRVRADNDAYSALAGGLLGGPGVLLISGTGSACLGRNEQGQTWRAGGWGYRLDDVGSAYALGLAAMIAVTRAADHRGQPTVLTEAVRQALGLKEIREMYRRVHEQKLERNEIANLAPSVVAAARAGDGVARRILEIQADGLTEMVITVVRYLHLKEPRMALTGGVITSAREFRELFLERLSLQLPTAQLVEDGLPPVLGSVLLAAELTRGGSPGQSFLETLRRTSPSILALSK